MWQSSFGFEGEGIGALVLDSRLGNHGRKAAVSCSAGYQAVIDECARNHEIEIVGPADALKRRTLLVSLTSPIEVEKLYHSPVYGTHGGTTIMGGFCALNPWCVYDLCDVMTFGRAEDQMDSILAGERFPNVWRKRDDPFVEGHYEIRQASRLLEGESSVGCPWRCQFCQYTAIRRRLGAAKYDPGMITPEDNWLTLKIDKPGRYVTALDGWSEDSRYRVQKPISNEAIISKLRKIQALDLPAACVLKVYMIVGFPWETPASVLRDIWTLRQLLADADAGSGGRVVLMFLMTPFSPEPLTPMQCDPVNMVEWRPVIEQAGRALYWSEHLEAFILPQIPLLRTLLKRVAINRCRRDNREAVRDYVLDRGPLPTGIAGESEPYPWLTMPPPILASASSR